MSYIKDNTKIESIDWTPTEFEEVSYEKLRAEADILLKSKPCSCGANGAGVKELFISGSSHLMVPDMNNSCDKCGGTGLIQK